MSYAYEFKSGVKLNHLLFMDDIILPDESEIKGLAEGDVYKYQGA